MVKYLLMSMALNARVSNQSETFAKKPVQAFFSVSAQNDGRVLNAPERYGNERVKSGSCPSGGEERGVTG